MHDLTREKQVYDVRKLCAGVTLRVPHPIKIVQRSVSPSRRPRPRNDRGDHLLDMPNLSELRQSLDLLLEAGMAEDAVDHARQIAMITSIVSQAFEAEGLRCTLVGGSAIEIYAPGIFKSGDIDLVVEELRGVSNRERLNPVFADLGFEIVGRHWRRGDLFV